MKNAMDGVQIDQIDLIQAIMEHLIKAEKIKTVNSRQYNTIIKAANIICDEMAKPHVHAVPGMTMDQWFASDDTGISSKFLANWLSPEARFINPNRQDGHPHDVADFARCVKMVRATGLEEAMNIAVNERMANYPEWNRVLWNWYNWVAMLDTGDTKRLYEQMQEEKL